MRKLLLLPAVVAAVLVASMAPASAQYIPATIDVTPSCNNLRLVTTWVTVTVTSPEVGGTVVNVTAVDAAPSPDAPNTVTLVGTNPIPAGESAQWIVELPGTYTGTVAITVLYDEGGQQETFNGTATITTPCIAPGTTVTTAAPTTTAVAATVTPAFTG